MNADQQDKNIVNLEEARRRQRVPKTDPGGGRGKTAKKPHGRSTSNPTAKIWVYIQVLVFLAAVSYFMQLCRGP